MYEYVQNLRQFCTTIIAEDCTMDDLANIAKEILKNLFR